MKRKLLAILVLLAMCISLAPAMAEEELPFVTIDWYFGQAEQTDAQILNDALNEILLEKFNCNVNMHFWSGDEYWDNMRVMISSGQDVGIIGFGSQTKLDYVTESQRGAYYPLDDLLTTIGADTYALFDEEIWEAMRINGNIYGIPSLKDNGYFISLVYNATMAEELGIDMESVEYNSFDDWEEVFYEVKEKRDAAHPEWADYPVVWDTNLAYPYYFAFETFFNDAYFAVCNIDGIDDVEGYDSNTVFNFYDTPEYMEFAKLRQRWVADGIQAYDYTDRSDWQYTGAVFGWVGWGYTYMEPHMYGDAFETKMIMSDTIWTETNNYFSAGTAISANCADPERAMMVLNEVNTNPEVATMLRFGVEGVHYTYNEEGRMEFTERNSDPAARGYYMWYAAPLGNLLIVNAPADLTGPNNELLTEMARLNAECAIPTHMGFSFNTENVVNEVAACTNIVMQYQSDIATGKLNSQEDVEAYVNEFREQLKANGVDTIVAEVQRQIDEWMAARDAAAAE